MNSDELYELFSSMSVEEIKSWLTEYMNKGQPDSMNKSMTMRALACWASMAIEGINKEDMPFSYIDTKYGAEFYFHMCGL